MCANYTTSNNQRFEMVHLVRGAGGKCNVRLESGDPNLLLPSTHASAFHRLIVVYVQNSVAGPATGFSHITKQSVNIHE